MSGSKDDVRTPFGDALHRIFDRNERDDAGRPDSLRSLGRELARRQGDASERKVEEWRRRLRRYASGDKSPSPDTVKLIATALGAEPGEFPAPVPRESLRQRVAELEAENRELRALLDRSRESA